jgi:hypothetical protein
VPKKDSVKNALLYSFQKCEFEQIKCDPAEQLERIGRITESFYYVLIGLACLSILSLLSGLSLFPIMPLVAFFIFMGHTWNYRLTCTPNIPNCFFDDTYLWIKTYQPKLWDEYFPELSKGGQCHENYLWSSAYLMARTPLNFILEFVIYQSDAFTGSTDYDTYQDWAKETPLKNECFIVRLPHLVFIPAFLYAFLTFGNLISYGVAVLTTVLQSIPSIFSAVYAMERASVDDRDDEMQTNLVYRMKDKLVELGFLKEKED